MIANYWTTTTIENFLDFDDGYTVILSGRLSPQVHAALLARQCLVNFLPGGCVVIVAADMRQR